MSDSARRAYHRAYYQEHRTSINKRRRRVQQPGEKTLQQERKVFFPIRLQESIVAQMQRMAYEAIALGKYPWKTPSEVARALIIKGLQSMKGDETVDGILPKIDISENLQLMIREQRHARSVLSNARQLIDDLLQMGATKEAAQYFSNVMTNARSMEETVWSEWLINEMTRSYPELAHTEGKTPYVALTKGMKDKQKKKNLRVVK